jgi:hypothetical protein
MVRLPAPSEGVVSKISGLINRLATARLPLRATVDLVSMYLGPEQRMNSRDQITTQGVIWRDDPYSIVICTVRDMSPAGVGLLLPDLARPLPAQFDLTFDRITRQCIAVWRQPGRLGLQFKPMSIFLTYGWRENRH